MNGGTLQLVAMANDIANFFVSESDWQTGIDGVVRHITMYWEPRMRGQIVAHLRSFDGAGLNDLARAAVTKLAEIQPLANQ